MRSIVFFPTIICLCCLSIYGLYIFANYMADQDYKAISAKIDPLNCKQLEEERHNDKISYEAQSYAEDVYIKKCLK